MKIGLISDTHLPQLLFSLDQLGPEVGDALRGVDLILHGGDVTVKAVIDWCEQFAPVLVARGNNDIFDDPRMSEHQFLDVDGVRIGMAHELRPESRPIAEILRSSLDGEQVDVLIGGDTHVERLEYRDGVLLINSGSPSLPHHFSTPARHRRASNDRARPDRGGDLRARANARPAQPGTAAARRHRARARRRGDSLAARRSQKRSSSSRPANEH